MVASTMKPVCLNLVVVNESLAQQMIHRGEIRRLINYLEKGKCSGLSVKTMNILVERGYQSQVNRHLLAFELGISRSPSLA